MSLGLFEMRDQMPMAGLEPARAVKSPTDFKSVASAISPHRRFTPSEKFNHEGLITAKRIHGVILLNLRVVEASLLRLSVADNFSIFKKLGTSARKTRRYFCSNKNRYARVRTATHGICSTALKEILTISCE
jgi:hypothetical protein